MNNKSIRIVRICVTELKMRMNNVDFFASALRAPVRIIFSENSQNLCDRIANVCE